MRYSLVLPLVLAGALPAAADGLYTGGPDAAPDLVQRIADDSTLGTEALLSPEGDLIAQGRYIATAADCAACHTAPGGKDMAGGYAIASPMGAIIASNITPSKEFGIGNWSEEQFAKALRQGVAPDGHLYPAMPYTAYAGMTDADVHALYSYLMQQVQPVDVAPAQQTQLGFPYDQRWLMAGWNLMFAGGTPAQAADVAPGAEGRGAYLVNVLGHCQTCHTPRNLLMGETSSAYLGGADLNGWHAPNITSDKISGIGGWSKDEIVSYLRSGAAHGKAQAGGAMAEAVGKSFRHLSDADLEAIADYLKTVPAIHAEGQTIPSYGVTKAADVQMMAFDAPIDHAPRAMADGSSTDGAEIYAGACSSCHQLDGAGTADQFYPSLSANSATGGLSAANLVMAVTNGIHRETNGYTVSMPAFGDTLSDPQIAAVSNYVLTSFGNKDLSVTAQDVAQMKAGGPTPWLLRATPWLLGGAVLVLVLLLAALIGVIRRKR
ncbi:cytochrome c [Thioclava sp. GXIMD4216]|uniref:cytochrome c n=1 Tax=Thioclava sp. GXIMD4216 TaxID=3131929 RepID=UPI0030CC1ED6